MYDSIYKRWPLAVIPASEPESRIVKIKQNSFGLFIISGSRVAARDDKKLFSVLEIMPKLFFIYINKRHEHSERERSQNES